MSESTQSEPVMAGSNDASNEDKRAGLIEQVDHDHGDEGNGVRAAHLRDRMNEAGVEPEDPRDLAE
ncbi:MAG: hypothetical protein M3N46_08930 [Actinomycetota bacterium]|nr:hypothetical protein [Actinomycetota bacterium]